MGKSNTNHARKALKPKRIIQARIPPHFFDMMEPMETKTEFLVRALTALRDSSKPVEQDSTTTSLLQKLVDVFVEKRMKVRLTKDEIELVKKIATRQQ